MSNYEIKIEIKNLFAKNMDDKNDEYSHIITSLCSSLLSGHYGINPADVFPLATYSYRGVLEQYYLVWFNLIGGIISPQ